MTKTIVSLQISHFLEVTPVLLLFLDIIELNAVLTWGYGLVQTVAN